MSNHTEFKRMIKIEIIDPQTLDADVLRKTAAYLLELAGADSVTITLPSVSRIGDTVEVDAKGRNVKIQTSPIHERIDDSGIEDTRYRTLEDIGLMPVPPAPPASDIPWNAAATEETAPVVTPPKKRASRAKVAATPSVPVPPVFPSVPSVGADAPLSDPNEDQYKDLMSIITENMATGKLPPNKMLEVLAEFECSSVVMVKDIPGLLPKVLARFREVVAV